MPRCATYLHPGWEEGWPGTWEQHNPTEPGRATWGGSCPLTPGPLNAPEHMSLDVRPEAAQQGDPGKGQWRRGRSPVLITPRSPHSGH